MLFKLHRLYSIKMKWEDNHKWQVCKDLESEHGVFHSTVLAITWQMKLIITKWSSQ